MKINIWLILIIGAAILSVIVIVDNMIAKLMGGFILLVLLAYLAEVSRDEQQQISKMQRALDKLRNAYNELDEQAKIIIRTDLELNRTQEELDKKVNGLYTLHEMGKLISSTLDVQKLFAQITEPLILKLGFERTIIFLCEEGAQVPECKAAIGFDAQQIETIKQANINTEFLQAVFERGSSVWVKSFENASTDQRQWLELFGVASFVIVPIVIKEKVEGYIFVGNTTLYHYVSEGDIDSLFILSNQLAVALENARLYEELKRSHDDLEIRVQERTKELGEANRQLVKLNKMKSDFVSAVSHELRTPLTSIKGYASILSAGKLGDVSNVQAEKLNKINVHSDELIKLVNDLLDIARIESGRVGMSIKHASLTEIIKSVADLFFPQTEEKKIDLRLQIPDSPVMVWMDSGQISRVFINLIANAMKFTPQDGAIIISVSPADEYINVDVADTGIGINLDDIPKLFDEFYRVENAINAEKKGTGLGLSLVKKIIEAHKGKIWATSELGKGTVFHFTLSTKKIEDSAISVS
ncbi:MAG: GAF domain-containing sensor histidine kinase [Candidatus Omnitrophica bacterium]|nr:GAF domain-containing sensor histidine kinase [Candidatus Omnitrophota bacterium]MBU4479482.1 GAF domain-containing sensor histidine kinase [Candidatus Omnitrophota bacterium]